MNNKRPVKGGFSLSYPNAKISKIVKGDLGKSMDFPTAKVKQQDSLNFPSAKPITVQKPKTPTTPPPSKK